MLQTPKLADVRGGGTACPAGQLAGDTAGEAGQDEGQGSRPQGEEGGRAVGSGGAETGPEMEVKIREPKLELN